MENKIQIYQGEKGEIQFKGDFKKETIWGNLNQIAILFGKNKSTISRHIKNIFESGELNKKMVVAFFATTTKHGAIKGKTQTKQVEYFNLDLIISVGYRVNSIQATQFRKWATSVLNTHLTKGYTINKNLLQEKQELYLKVLDDIKLLSKNTTKIGNDDILELIKSFSNTWFNLESYDKQIMPTSGITQIRINFSADHLYKEIEVLKKELINKKEATELFAQEKEKGNLKGIFGNIMQSVFGEDAYRTIEEKSAHLLYFIIKNHPFTDGNKRTGAFSFIWFLKKSDFDFSQKITPEGLTTLALLIAESNPKDKDKMIGLILLMLNN